MLYLKQIGSEAAEGCEHCVPLGEVAAAELEAALFATDAGLRSRHVQTALESDSALAGWALRLAEHRTSRTINLVGEAAAWLCGHLEIELAAALMVQPPCSDSSLRFFSLATKLAKYEHKLVDFDRRLEQEKLDSLKELAYGASHEINNPLANIAARAQTLLADESDPERARKLLAIHRQALRAHEMISDLMLFARPPRLEKRATDLGPFVRGVVEQFRREVQDDDACGVEIQCTLGSKSLAAVIDKAQLAVAIHALLKNSCEALAGNGHIWVTVREAGRDGPRAAEILVRDDGPGISEDIRPHIFDPFFSGREAGRGLGFGLSKCWRIVTDHDGQVVVSSDRGGGCEIVIQLPLA